MLPTSAVMLATYTTGAVMGSDAVYTRTGLRAHQHCHPCLIITLAHTPLLVPCAAALTGPLYRRAAAFTGPVYPCAVA